MKIKRFQIFCADLVCFYGYVSGFTANNEHHFISFLSSLFPFYSNNSFLILSFSFQPFIIQDKQLTPPYNFTSSTKIYSSKAMEMVGPTPKSMSRAKEWTDRVEEAYRFQCAGYRDELEYKFIHKTDHIDRWPHNGYVKKLQRKDGSYFYYNRTRECPEKDVPKTKIYAY